MKWHRNPFFNTVVLPPSVAPSVLTSARPSADLETATAQAVLSAAAHTRPNAAHLRPGGVARASADLADLSEKPEEEPVPEEEDIAPAPARVALPPPPPPQQQPDSAPNGILAEAAARAAAQQKRHSFRNRLSLHRRREPQVPRLTICEPSDRLTGYQFFYIFILDGLGAFVLSGGINFAIAYAMYKTIDTTAYPIRLFQFPNTLVGDATVTIFIQCVITWFIELVLVNRDLRSGHIQPIGFLPEPKQPLLRWFLLLDRQAPEENGSESSNSDDDDLRRPLSHAHTHDPHRCRCSQPAEEERYAPGSLAHWVVFLVSQLMRALLVGVAMWLLMWAPSLGILTAVGDHRSDGDWWYDAPSWAPPIFKLVFGGLLALLTTPPFAAFWLVRCGWAVRANERHLATAQTETV